MFWLPVIVPGKVHGGPYQFLHHQMPDIEKRNGFVHWLFDMFKLQDDVPYHKSSIIPACDPEVIGQQPPRCFHIAAFGFDSECTSKSAPFEDVCTDIMEEILKDGFVTSGDPLIVQQPVEYMNGELKLDVLWKPDEQGVSVLHTQSLGYIKGMARVSTILALLYTCWDKNYDIEARHPKMYTSVLRVWALHAPASSKREIALANMKLSARGSIRRAPNVITILFMVQKLKTSGDSDFASFLKIWNMRSARSHHVLGKKAQALKLLIEAPPKVQSGKWDGHIANSLGLWPRW